MENEKSKMENELEVTNKLLLEMVRNQKNNMQSLLKLYFVTVICFVIIIASMVIGFFWYESQFDVLESDVNYEYQQEVSGNDSEINNVSGDMYKDNSTHNEQGGE